MTRKEALQILADLENQEVSQAIGVGQHARGFLEGFEAGVRASSKRVQQGTDLQSYYSMGPYALEGAILALLDEKL